MKFYPMGIFFGYLPKIIKYVEKYISGSDEYNFYLLLLDKMAISMMGLLIGILILWKKRGFINN